MRSPRTNKEQLCVSCSSVTISPVWPQRISLDKAKFQYSYRVSFTVRTFWLEVFAPRPVFFSSDNVFLGASGGLWALSRLLLGLPSSTLCLVISSFPADPPGQAVWVPSTPEKETPWFLHFASEAQKMALTSSVFAPCIFNSILVGSRKRNVVFTFQMVVHEVGWSFPSLPL